MALKKKIPKHPKGSNGQRPGVQIKREFPLNTEPDEIPDVYNKKIKKERDDSIQTLPLAPDQIKVEDDVVYVPQIPSLQEESWSLRFDHVFHLKNVDASLHVLAKNAHTADYRAKAVEQLLIILRKALGDRISQIEHFSPETEVLTFGINFSKHCFKDTVNRGPEGNTAAAAEFREFWGPEVQLRRFPDGGISEAIIWKSATESQKRLICSRIIKSVLKRHAAIDAKSITYMGNLWDETLQYQRIELPQQWPAYGSGEEYLVQIGKTYDTLARDLRNIKDLPLGISNVRSTAPSVRFTEPFPVLPFTIATEKGADQQRVWTKYIQPYAPIVPVQVILEGSSKWPETLEAVRRLKTAFHLLIAEALRKLGYIVIVPDVDVIQVWKDCFCFGVEIFHFGELGLARKVTMPDGRIRLENTPLYNKLHYKYELLPKLSGAIAGLATQEESFGVACRLAKRWAGSQLFDGYISGECLELLMAEIYLNPEPHQVPVSPDVALIRFWNLIVKQDWLKKPLLLNFNREWQPSEAEALRRRFQEERASFPPMTILTPFDPESSWTGGDFSRLILKRFVALARTSLGETSKDRMNSVQCDWKKVFRVPEEEWDVVIHVAMNQNSRRHQLLDITGKSKFSNYPVVEYRLSSGGPGKNSTFDFDSVGIYVEILRKTYGKVAYFLADPAGGLAIYVKWKTANLTSVPFSTSLHGQTVPAGRCNDKTAILTPNLQAIIEDFSIIGRNLVDNVEVRSERWKI